jgi:hypothetical protein
MQLLKEDRQREVDGHFLAHFGGIKELSLLGDLGVATLRVLDLAWPLATGRWEEGFTDGPFWWFQWREVHSF